MNHRQKIEQLESFNSESEFRYFLMDMIKKIGFTDVQHTHRYGSVELGKDIIGKIEHKIEGSEWYAFVIKLGKIDGGTNNIETVKNQIKQSFEYPYRSINGDKIHINKVKVVTNSTISKGAQESLDRSPELNIYRNYSFWWNEVIIELIDKYYNEFWFPQLNEFIEQTSTKNFVNALLHELRYPIQSILSNNDFLKFKIQNDKIDKSSLISLLTRTEEDLVQLNNSISNFEHGILKSEGVSSLNIEIIDVYEVVKKVVSIIEPISKKEKNISIDINIHGRPVIRGDKNLVSQTIYNLLTNSIKYSNRNSPKIEIGFKQIENNEGNWKVIEIKDYGIGVLNDEKESIFKAYYRGGNGMKLYPSGLGIGLYVANKILTEHKGTLKLTNLMNPTIFSLYFPI